MGKVFCKKNASSFCSIVFWLFGYKKAPHLLETQAVGFSAYECVDSESYIKWSM